MMRAHTITTTRLALLLSLLALGALGLIACGGADDEDSATEAKVSADTTTKATGHPDTTTEAKLSRERVQELWAKLSREQVQELRVKLSRERVQELKREANAKAKLSREQVQELKREANTWASVFAVSACNNRYTGQPICGRLICRRDAVGPPIENCTRVSAAYQRSFADATVEDIKSERILLVGWTDSPLYEAAVKFSNGEAVVFAGLAPSAPEPPDGSCAGAGAGESCSWNIAEADHNRRFVESAAPRE
jgi:hypothetical protein